MKKLGTSFGSAEPQEPYPLPCLNLITLITYQCSLLLFVFLACPWLALLLRTLADTHFLQGCWFINIRDSVFSFISLYCRNNHFTLFQKNNSPNLFYFSPPWVLSPTFHFSLPFSPS
jgi:hypothetical protein